MVPNKLIVAQLVKKFESFMEAEFYYHISRSDDKCCNMYPLNEIKSRNARAKAELARRCSFHLQIGLKFKEETSKVLHLEHNFVWCSNLDTSESKPETPGKF